MTAPIVIVGGGEAVGNAAVELREVAPEDRMQRVVATSSLDHGRRASTSGIGRQHWRRRSRSARRGDGYARRVDGCVFCQIISGDTPSSAVLEQDDFVAFLDTRPVFKGHVLLVPREHVETLPDLPAALRDGFLAAAQDLAVAVKEALGAQGSFVAINNTVSQSVPHLHLHVVPRTKGDGLRGFFWPRTKYAAGEIDDYAVRLRAALND